MSVFMFLIIAYYISVGYSKVFSRCDLAMELKHKHNIPEDQLATWVCIAQYESYYNTTAVGHTNADRSGDHGLFQISDIYWCSPPGIGLACGVSCAQLEDDDITDDVTCIRRIYRAHEKQTGNGFSAWAVYEPYCKNNVSMFIDDCFPTINNKAAFITQAPNVQVTLSQTNKISTSPAISFHLYRPWWLQTLKNPLNGQKISTLNSTMLRPFSFCTEQIKACNKNSLLFSTTFTQNPFWNVINSRQNQDVLVATQKPGWFDTQGTKNVSSFTTLQLIVPPLTTSKIGWPSSTTSKPVWPSSATRKLVWSSSNIPKSIKASTAVPKRIWSSSTLSQLAYFNNQKTNNMNSTRKQITVSMTTPVLFSNNKVLISSRKIPSAVTQKPSWFYNQTTSSYFTRKSKFAKTLNPPWSHILKTNAYSVLKQISTTHKPLWYETWYQNNFVNKLFLRKQ